MGRGWRWIEVGRLWFDEGVDAPAKASGAMSLGLFGEIPCIMRPGDRGDRGGRPYVKILARSDALPLNFMRGLVEQGAPPAEVLPASRPPPATDRPCTCGARDWNEATNPRTCRACGRPDDDVPF